MWTYTGQQRPDFAEMPVETRAADGQLAQVGLAGDQQKKKGSNRFSGRGFVYAWLARPASCYSACSIM